MVEKKIADLIKELNPRSYIVAMSFEGEEGVRDRYFRGDGKPEEMTLMITELTSSVEDQIARRSGKLVAQ